MGGGRAVRLFIYILHTYTRCYSKVACTEHGSGRVLGARRFLKRDRDIELVRA